MSEPRVAGSFSYALPNQVAAMKAIGWRPASSFKPSQFGAVMFWPGPGARLPTADEERAHAA